MKNHTPNGLCINQLKKDANRIKKEKKIKLVDALDYIAKTRTNFYNWKSLIKYSLDSDIISLFSIEDINKHYNKFSVYKKRPMITVYTTPGYAADHILKKITSNIKNEEGILYVTPYKNNDLDCFFKNKTHDKIEYSTNKNLDDYEKILNILKLVKSKLNKYGFLILNDFYSLNNNDINVMLEQIIKKCSDLSISIYFMTSRGNEIFNIIDKYSSVIIFPFDGNSVNEELTKYTKDPEKNSLVLREGLIDFKVYNYTNKEKTNISIEYGL